MSDREKHWLGFSFSIVLWLASMLVCRADEPQFLQPTDPERARQLRQRPWIETIAAEIPPLTNDSDGHLPMIMWHGVGFQPLQESELRILRERGLCQHLQVSVSMIESARVLQDAGMPVVLMEGRTDHWPYSLAPDPNDWAHQFDATYIPPWFGKDDTNQWHGACPNQIEGWKALADQTRETMQAFRDAGVKVDAVLVDYEGDPYPWGHLFEQLEHCKRCRSELPAEIVMNKTAWRADAWQRYVSLYDQYFAAPIREVFPECRVTNWHVVFSSRETPVRYFAGNVDLPELRPRHFSATNPICYGSDLIWNQLWDRSAKPTATAVDDFYANELIHQVIADRKNRESAGASSVEAIPWVARVCKIDDGGEQIPIMSRDRYRESLGKIWSEGVATMQIFNPMHEGYEELALMELQDAVLAYDRKLKE